MTRLLDACGLLTLLAPAPSHACSISCALSFAPGPLSGFEFLVIAPVGVLVAGVLLQAFRYTVRPGEQSPMHIKHRVLEESDPAGPSPPPPTEDGPVDPTQRRFPRATPRSVERPGP